MSPAPHHRQAATAKHTLGCVAYLNATPLIHGVADPQTRVVFDVPSRLLDGLLSGAFDLALCPVIDACRDGQPADAVRIVPVGGIGSQGPTWTVRLFSRVPIPQIRCVYLDTDSHTSVALLRVLLAEMHGLTPTWIDHDFAQGPPCDAESMLLIGDKIITAPPPPEEFPHQLDLGKAWHQLTGLPFVFAVWMARPDAVLGDLPQRLATTLETNLQQIDSLADRYAAAHGWPSDLARDYLGRVLRYRVGPAELQAIRRFAALAHQHNAATGPVREPTILAT